MISRFRGLTFAFSLEARCHCLSDQGLLQVHQLHHLSSSLAYLGGEMLQLILALEQPSLAPSIGIQVTQSVTIANEDWSKTNQRHNTSVTHFASIVQLCA